MGKKISDPNKFNFFVETELHKGKNDTGEDVVWIDGIASSSAVKDSDQETLFPIGFNVKPLLETGLVNYNHQGSKDSNANVGITTEAKVINKGQDLYVKCMLWPCPQTDGIVRTYENFKKYAPNRKVGFSIEGMATSRDIMDAKKILTADVTGLAVTFSPKNKNSLMNIIKGEYSEAFVPIDDTNVEEEEKETEKAITTDTISPATPESVEHDTKEITNKKPKEFGKSLKKSEIYIEIKNKYPTASIADIKKIYSLVEDSQKKLFSNVS